MFKNTYDIGQPDITSTGSRLAPRGARFCETRFNGLNEQCYGAP